MCLDDLLYQLKHHLTYLFFLAGMTGSKVSYTCTTHTQLHELCVRPTSAINDFFSTVQLSLLLGHWYEIMALYYVKSILTEISASRQDRRVLQKSKIIRIEFLSKWGMLQTSRYV